MERVPGLGYSYFNACQVLRERFRRFSRQKLPERIHRESGQRYLVDVDVLALLRDTASVRNNVPSVAAAEYVRIQSDLASGLPDYQEALDRGWFRQIGDELISAWPLRDYVRTQEPLFAEALENYIRWLYGYSYQVAHPGNHATASEFEAYLLADREAREERPLVLSADWIAARLWDTVPMPDIRTWADWWELLDRPSLLPVLAWSSEHAQVFRNAALTALREGNLPRWGEDGREVTWNLRFGGDQRGASSLDEYPQHLLGLYRRLCSEPTDGQRVYESYRLTSLVGPLVKELPHIVGPIPSATANTLAELALMYPVVLDALITYLRQEPEALAYFVFCPHATSLVCYLVATWDRIVPGQWEQRDAAAETVQLSLLMDCLEVLKHFVVQEQASPEEYGRLLAALQAQDAERHEGPHGLPVVIEHLRSLPASVQQSVRGGLLALGLEGGSTTDFTVLLKALAVLGTNLKEDEAARISRAYKELIGALKSEPDVATLDASAAGALAGIGMNHFGAIRTEVLAPLDVAALIKSRPEDLSRIGAALRAHMRVLARAVASYPGAVPEALVDALAKAIHSGACSRAERQQVDAFEFAFEPWRKSRQRPVEIDLIEAIRRLDSPAQKKKLVDALLKVEEPLVLAALLQRLPWIHHDAIRNRLEQLKPADVSPASWIPQLDGRIDALLDAGLDGMAALYLEDRNRQLEGRESPDGGIAQLRAKLHLHLLRNEFSEIEHAVIPAGLAGEREKDARRTIDFFRGLMWLTRMPKDPGKAAVIFSRLYRERPNTTYAINLLASRIDKLLEGNLFKTLSGEKASLASYALQEADNQIGDGEQLDLSGRSVHDSNCATLLLAMGRPREALARLSWLDPTLRTADSLAFEAVANARIGDRQRAELLLRVAREMFGPSNALVNAAADHVAHVPDVGSHVGGARVLMDEQGLARIRAGLLLFAGLSPEEQAAVVRQGSLPLEQVLAEVFRDSAATFEAATSYLKLHDNHYFDEDDLNGLFAEMVRGRIESKFGWAVSEQSPGGFTAAGNAGRRDFSIEKNGVDIAVFEALKADRPKDERIVKHFQKLLAYSNASLFFHVTYSFRKEGRKAREDTEMFAAIREMAESTPDGVDFLGLEDIAADGARPYCLRGAYKRHGTDVTVFFFLIDMQQGGLRAAIGAPDAVAGLDQ